MVEKIFSGEALTILRKALDAASLRHQVLSDNIANVNTPGFKRSDVVFQQELKAALSANEGVLPLNTTDPKHIQFPEEIQLDKVSPKIILQNDTISRNDLNNVDIDTEMAKLAENTIYYNSLAQMTSLKLTSLRSVLNNQ